MEQSDLLVLMIGASLIGLAALLVLVGSLLSRTSKAKEESLKVLKTLRTDRNNAILKAVDDPSDFNVQWMWEKIDDYDRQRGFRP